MSKKQKRKSQRFIRLMLGAGILALSTILWIFFAPQQSHFSSISSQPKSTLVAEVKNSSKSTLGIVSQLYASNEFPTRDKSLTTIKSLGINFVRTGFVWSQIQPTPGTWKWETYDALIASAQKNEIHLLGVVRATPKWASPISQHLDEYAAFLDAVVARYGDAVSDWEIWNEPNKKNFWKQDAPPPVYFDILKRSYQIIKSRQSSSNVLLGGMANQPSAFELWDKLLELGAANYVDGIAFHPYRTKGEDLVPIYQRIRSLLAKYTSSTKPIWVTEYGWNTKPNPLPKNTKVASPHEQAVKIIRTYLVHLAEGGSHFFVYEFRDDVCKKGCGKGDGQNFGVLKPDFTPKEAAQAISWMQQKLGTGFFIDNKQYFKDGALVELTTKGNVHYIVTWGNEAYKVLNNSFLSRGKYKPETFQNLTEKAVIDGLRSVQNNQLKEDFVFWQRVS